MIDRRVVIVVGLVLGMLVLPATALALRLRAVAKARAELTAVMPRASMSTGVSQVGTLYASARATSHGCTASVVDSSRANTLITAAHCVSGSGAGMVFVPDQRGAQAPYGRWTVTSVYVEPEWLAAQSPRADVAFLTVAPRTINGVRTQIERVTGAYRLGLTATRAQLVTVPAFPAGSTGTPITCSAPVYLKGVFPAFDCHGYVAGTSGAPWVVVTPTGNEIVGIVGGPNQGGCQEYTSYSSPLGSATATAYERAAENARPDVAPRPASDGC